MNKRQKLNACDCQFVVGARNHILHCTNLEYVACAALHIDKCKKCLTLLAATGFQRRTDLNNLCDLFSFDIREQERNVLDRNFKHFNTYFN